MTVQRLLLWAQVAMAPAGLWLVSQVSNGSRHDVSDERRLIEWAVFVAYGMACWLVNQLRLGLRGDRTTVRLWGR